MSAFRLKIQRVQQACLFELSWGNGQQLTAPLDYPDALTRLYQDWQRAYLGFYQSAQLPIAPSPPSATPDRPSLRGRAGPAGNLLTPPNWQARLVQAEANLLYEFHQWLRSAELFEIRREIARSAATLAIAGQTLDLFLTCNSLELERFPWEAWEIGTELGTGRIRIARTPPTIRAAVATHPTRRKRARILAILGDDTGLNFHVDRDAVKALAPIAEIAFLGWQAGQQPNNLKQQICTAIADPLGWDGIFFAGHSNETSITGGELAIAPGVSMTVSEMARSLTTAKEQGLKFAIFNSCSGLSIAQSLIDLGLSQVVVMREPIHNRVAQEFLLQFLRSLTASHDIHDALLDACQFLKLERHLTYPSAYLIPSLFCHPDAALFRIRPIGWKQQIQPWLPTRTEAIALGTLLCLSLWQPAQDWLMEQRMMVQAMYRNVTGQLPVAAAPPVRLVHIDEKSIRRAGISNPNPIDRAYLGRLVDRLTALNARVIGLDYVLDRPQPGKDQSLARSVQKSVEKGTWFVFGAQTTAEGEVGLTDETSLASLNWSVQGYIEAFPWYLELLPAKSLCTQTCPFAYLLTLAQVLHQSPTQSSATQSSNPQPSDSHSTPPRPNLQSRTDLRTQLIDYLHQPAFLTPGQPNTTNRDRTLNFLREVRLSPITRWSQSLGQLWLQPVLDFSIPPDRVYEIVSAWQLLAPQETLGYPTRLQQQVVIIASGGYDEAGVSNVKSDNFSPPAAIRYWRSQPNSPTRPQQLFTGSEAHAYMVYHLLTQRLVVPVPDAWMLGVGVLLAKPLTLLLHWLLQASRSRRRNWLLGLLVGTGIYALVCVQVFVSTAILLPWCLPSAIVWLYCLPPLLRRSSHAKLPRS